jgi:hypothetical protein
MGLQIKLEFKEEISSLKVISSATLITGTPIT